MTRGKTGPENVCTYYIVHYELSNFQERKKLLHILHYSNDCVDVQFTTVSYSTVLHYTVSVDGCTGIWNIFGNFKES